MFKYVLELATPTRRICPRTVGSDAERQLMSREANVTGEDSIIGGVVVIGGLTHPPEDSSTRNSFHMHNFEAVLSRSYLINICTLSA